MSFFSALFGNKNESLGTITVLDKSAYAAALSAQKVKPVDVRTASEYNSGHIKNAMNIDVFNSSNFANAFEKFDKEKAVFVYCRSGARSQKAARKLLKMGFSQVYDLKGGYSAWN